jgi:hypothetical protein
LQLNDLGRLYLIFVFWVRVFACTTIIPVMSYMSNGLVGYLMGSEISRDARKLARIPRVIKENLILNKRKGHRYYGYVFLISPNLSTDK